MTRSDLAKLIAKKTNLNIRQAENMIIAFGAVVSDVLARGEKVVYSNFGTFYTVHYPSKVITHPKLGAAKKMVMLPTNAVKWMPSGNVKEMVKDEKIKENPTVHKSSNVSKNSQNISFKKGASLELSQNKNLNNREETPITTNALHEFEVKPEKSTDNTSAGEEHDNIYEELMKDGSKEVSTFAGSIKVHKNKGIWNKIFNKDRPQEIKINTKQRNEKVSLVDSGIFGKNESSIPVHKTVGEKKIDSIKSEITKHVDVNGISRPQPKPLDTLVENQEKPEYKEIEINHFPREKAKISFVDLSSKIISKEILAKIPEKLARKYKVAPIEEDENGLVVAMADPEDIEAKELIKKQVQTKIIPRLAAESDINTILDQYSGLETEVKEAIATADKEKEIVDPEVKKEVIVSASDTAPASRIVTSLLRRAIREKASDLHIEPSITGVEVRFRLDGILKKKITLPLDIEAAVISRIKILSNLKIDEQRLPQDGRFSINFENRQIDFRVSTMPISNGEKIVMRVLDKSSGILSVEDLGIRGSALETLKNNIEKSHGMALVTGPTGSGKTTTLYALIGKLYNEGVNIVTLEDPIEYQMAGINQSQVNAEIDYTFANGLRSIVRQDPDIIMIGEIRDTETAEMAVHAALTGHIVLSTLHTNDASGAAPRLIDMGVEPFLLTSSLNMVIGQRLARKVCEECKEELAVSDVELKRIKEEIGRMPKREQDEIAKKEIRFYHGKGCKNCNETGYKGRVGLYEILDINEEVKEAILAKKSSSFIEEKAIASGMVTMLQDGILKALEGTTTIEEVWRTTKE